MKGTFFSDEFSSFIEQGTQKKPIFSQKFSLFQRTRNKTDIFSEEFSREQKSEMRNTSFKRTKKGHIHSLMLTMRKIEGIYLDSDYILRYDYLQAYAPHVYDKKS